MTHDWTAFARRVLLPGRPRLPEVRTAVLGVTDVRAAWEGLVARGFVPDASHESRGVFRERPAAADGPPWRPWRAEPDAPALPVTVDDAVVLACDPRGLALAGELALSFAARSAAWEAPPTPVAVTRVEWRVVAADGWFQHYGDRYRMTAVLKELMRALGAASTDFLSTRAVRAVLDVTGPGYAQRVADDVAAYVLWQEAVARDLHRPDGAAYRDLADPTEAMIDLWSTGYALDHLRDDAAVLVAPVL